VPTEVAGVRVGHWTDARARTGCTVVVLPEGTVASGEVRGGAPATREFALLEPTRLVRHIDAVLLTGGSAFGLAAADGVATELEGEGRGFATSAGPVPIVVGLGLFDLAVGDPTVRPGPAEGRAAFRAASSGTVAAGPVGAGTGATTGTWRGAGQARPGGLGTATERDGDLVLGALFAVNAFGDIAAADGALDDLPADWPGRDLGATNTTIGVVVTNAVLDKVGCQLLAQSAHDGLARALEPAHTRFDGDAVVCAATGTLGTEVSVDRLRHLATRVTTRAVLAVGRQ